MKIDIAVHGRFHAFDLAVQLQRRGAMGRLYTTYPALAARRFLPPEISLTCYPALELWRRFGARLGLAAGLPVGLPRRFAVGVARNMAGSSADILIGWSSATLEAIPVARSHGMKVVIERGSTHIAHQTDVLRAAYEAVGQTFTATPPEIIEREITEYNLADAIAVPSSIAADSFVQHGVAEDKLIVSRLGVDLARFQPSENPRSPDGPPRILCVGALGVRKGTATLIRAIDRLAGAAKLHLVGPVEKGFRPVLDALPLDHVTLTGPVSRDALPGLYRSADIFCLPSAEEGFGMVVLEAMACGLPVVISDQVGARDAVPEDAGRVVPVSDADALADALAPLVENADLRRETGTRARDAAVNGGNGWDDYVDRLWPSYEALVGAT